MCMALLRLLIFKFMLSWSFELAWYWKEKVSFHVQC